MAWCIILLRGIQTAKQFSHCRNVNVLHQECELLLIINIIMLPICSFFNVRQFSHSSKEISYFCIIICVLAQWSTTLLNYGSVTTTRRTHYLLYWWKVLTSTYNNISNGSDERLFFYSTMFLQNTCSLHIPTGNCTLCTDWFHSWLSLWTTVRHQYRETVLSNPVVLLALIVSIGSQTLMKTPDGCVDVWWEHAVALAQGRCNTSNVVNLMKTKDKNSF